MRMRSAAFALAIGALQLAGTLASPASALPAGIAFAESLLRYDPSFSDSCGPTSPNFMDPAAVLGAPDYSGGTNGTGALSIGNGGLLEVLFRSDLISNSGDSSPDLYIVEVGSSDEAVFVALRPALPTTPNDCAALGLQDTNQDGFFEIGRIPGGTSMNINLDSRFNQMVPRDGVQFDAVQIIDDLADHPECTTKAGADIDAIEALQPWVAVAPVTWSAVKALYRD